jgi:hypothetical protein
MAPNPRAIAKNMQRYQYFILLIGIALFDLAYFYPQHFVLETYH